MNRSFRTAATSSGFVVNSPMSKWFAGNDAETIFDRLEARGRTWKVYVAEPMPVSFTGVIHYPRLKDRLATPLRTVRRVRAGRRGGHAAGLLADRAEHADRPRRLPPGVRPLVLGRGGPGDGQPVLDAGGEAFLKRVFNAYRSATSETGANVWNTALLIGWDEPGGTYDHVPPGPVPPPDPAAPAGEFGFAFDRSGYRVPAVIVSPWVEAGSVFNEDATPRDPASWADPQAQSVPEWTADPEVIGQALSSLGKGLVPALRAPGLFVRRPVPRRLVESHHGVGPGHLMMAGTAAGGVRIWARSGRAATVPQAAAGGLRLT
jgi:phospholipase C